MLDLMEITDEEFETIRSLIHQRFGISLTAEKRSLVIGRLQKVIRRHEFSSFADYYNFVVEDKTGQALNELATRISTNHTFFYREEKHFEFFVETALPEAARRQREKHSRDIRVWSAGCSSGEEPYTLAMLMLEYFGLEYGTWQAGILATDLSNKVLEEAQAGSYTTDRLERLPEKLRQKYFVPSGGDLWQIAPRVKAGVTFRRFNLMNEKFPFRRQFDMIFCRNVMIYFDRETRRRLVEKFFEWTVPGGYLFIGHSESLPRGECPYRYLRPALYIKDSEK